MISIAILVGGKGTRVQSITNGKSKAEIKKDYEYLLRQWEQIRNLTLKSIAPSHIYEEGSVIKRTIRDLYSKEINEIMVEGETGFKEAKEYMKMTIKLINITSEEILNT